MVRVIVRENGYSTKKRAWILRYFEENPDREVSVNDIHDFLQQNELDVNVTTIYRYLDKLVEQGMVLKTLHGKKEQATYQYMNGRKECGHHLHLKCRKCGKIKHLDCGFMNEIASHIGKEHGFLIDCRESYLTGLCRECSEKEKKGNMENEDE